MCILCVIQEWSRRVATMLPWLVIPLIGLWALSQLLPPAFRFEITSPRLVCVFVLLVTLFWYEILTPKLSAWQAHRNAKLRERKKNEAIELQKLRKTATRRCRNCLTPYKDQNPGGGKFMCSYCGHISKRPVLDLPVPPGMGISNSGIIKDLVGKGGKLLNGKAWADGGWMCGHDWLENGNWAGGSFPTKSGAWRRTGNGVFGGDDHCLAENSYSGIAIFSCKLLTSFFLSIRWLWRKIFRSSSLREDAALDAEHRGMLAKRDGGNSYESRSDKARRKAEEKRQARLERELLEEEERKQREEVARLVEERRKLRDEKTEAEKDNGKGSSPNKERDRRREAEKKRQERKKDRDRGSSKSNSDAEELERRVSKESERKQDSDKKSLPDRQPQKSATESVKGQGTDMGRGLKGVSANSANRGGAGARYLDRMRGTFLSSSKAFGGGSFFGRAANTPAATSKENKPIGAVNHVYTSYKRDHGPPERIGGKSVMNLEDKSSNSPVLSDTQTASAPKKTWQQLFTRSSSVHPSANTYVISKPSPKFHEEGQSPLAPGQPPTTQLFDNPLNFGLPSPFTRPAYQNGTPSGSLGFSPVIKPIFSRAGEGSHEFFQEEPELFEDPSYVPDPASLLGPVSESLDNFQLDLGSGFFTDLGSEMPHVRKNVVTASEFTKPSPIESPISRLRGTEDRHNNANRFARTPKAPDTSNFNVGEASDDKRAWQMWDTSPLAQDGLSLIGAPASWLLNSERSRSSKEDILRPLSQNSSVSLFSKEDPVLPSIHTPQKDFVGCGRSGGTLSPLAGLNNQDPWVQKAFIPPLSDGENQLPLAPQGESIPNQMYFGSPSRSALTHPFEPSPANCWSNKEWAAQGSGEGIGNPSVSGPHIGGLFPPNMYSHPGDLIEKTE
ncbi:hypothetical protein ACJRO7_007070 [Eucalyptus globulus]|uniref:Stress response NST1-like protein n=1 Tax=Eucalyptus globulus TaxID=34317 RepID=A0ABD3IKV7_EUCGL